MVKVSIYIANLGAYNRGELIGQWIDLPAYENEINEVIQQVLKAGEPGDEEIAIHDYSTDIGLEIGEYDNIFKLSELLEQIEDADEITIKGLLYVLEDLEDVVECYNSSEYTIFHDIRNEKDLGYSLVENGYLGDISEVPERFKKYINYEMIGRDYTSGSFTIMKDLNIAIGIHY